MKRMTQVILFAGLLASIGLALPHDAQAYNWSLVVVDSAGDVGWYNSIAVGASGDLVISYHDGVPNYDLRFGMCDRSASTHGNCDETGDWSTEPVDPWPGVGMNTSMALDANGYPVILHSDNANVDLKFATASPPWGCAPGVDADSDGFDDDVECHVGTDTLDDCPEDPSHDAWPPDIVIDTVVDIFDAGTFLAAFPSAEGSPNYSQRLDLSPDWGVIDIFDALSFLAFFPSACTNP